MRCIGPTKKSKAT
jgi:pectinesterase